MPVRMVLCKQLRRSMLTCHHSLYRDTLARSITVCAPRLFPRQVRLHTNRQPIEPVGGSDDTHFPVHNSSAALGDSSQINELKKISYQAPDLIAVRCKELLAATPDVRRQSINDSEFSYKTRFGSIRFDKDNVPREEKRHIDISAAAPGSVLQSQNYNNIDEQYFGKALDALRDAERKTETDLSTSTIDPTTSTCVDHSVGFIDNQFFGEALQRDISNEHNSGKSPVVGSAEILHSRQELNEDKYLNYIDAVFFKEPDVLPEEESLKEVVYKDAETIEREMISTIIKPYRRISDFERALLNMDDESCATRPDLPFRSSLHTRDLEQRYVDSYKKQTTKGKDHLLDHSSTTPSSSVSPPPPEQQAESLPEPAEPPLDDSNTIRAAATKDGLYNRGTQNAEGTPESAFDYVLAQRKKQNKERLLVVKPDGSKYIPRYKSIINSVWTLSHRNTYEMQQLLKRCIIYNDHDMVALFKPYGLRVQSGGETGHEYSRYSLLDLLPQLGEVVGAKTPLHTVHRLDVNTTGVLLLARTEETAFKLRKMFKQHTLVKTYLAITKGVPSVMHGLIDIPLKECLLEDKRRMGLRPVLHEHPQKKHDGYKAVTKFKVLSHCNSTALMSIQPLTGVKHQIRSHLGLALSCPILADHKYSRSDTILPQKLPGDALDRLQMRQARVRDLPLMLHASSIFLPRFVDNKNIKISCPPPPHFISTMKALKLNSKLNVTNMKSMDYVDLGVPLV